jgi:hypothetical protein
LCFLDTVRFLPGSSGRGLVTPVSQYDVKPRIKPARQVEPIQRLKGIDKRVLNRIHRVFSVPEDADRVTYCLSLIPLNQMPKCLPVSRSARSYRGSIVHHFLSL